MATFKQIIKNYKKEMNTKEFFSKLDNWKQSNNLRFKGISEYSGSLLGKNMKYHEKRSYEREVYELISHNYEISININASKEKSIIECKILGKIEDNRNKNPRFNGLDMFKARFIDVFIKKNDIWQVKEFENSLKDFEEIFK